MRGVEPAQQHLTAASPAELLALAAVGKRLPALFQRDFGLRGGAVLSRYRGRGVEYDESRHYQPGDSMRHLDARVTARRGEPFTKVYREDRERALYLCIDDRACMHFASRGRFKRVVAAQAAMLLAWKAHHEGNPVAARLVHDDHTERFSLRRGRTAPARIVHALSAPARRESVDEAQLQRSLRDGLAGLSQDVPAGALLVVFSDFRGIDETAEARLLRAQRHCEVVFVAVHDILERRLPQAPGRYPVANDYGGALLFGAERDAQARLAARVLAREERIAALARSLRAPLLALATDAAPAEALHRLLRGRR